jgi:hypothetical protein
MRIMNRVQFLAMPENTLFCNYEPCNLGELRIKGATWGNDFLVQYTDTIKCKDSNEFFEILTKAWIAGESFEMDFDCMGRDAMFDDSQLFAVFDPDDVKQLIERLQQCVK